MSVRNVTAFFDKLESDKVLQAKVRALAEKKKSQEEAATAELIKVAAAAGFQFTAADLAKARKAKSSELSEEQLRTVAGGGGTPFWTAPCPLQWS